MRGPERYWAVGKESKSGGGLRRTQMLIRPQAKVRSKRKAKASQTSTIGNDQTQPVTND